MKLFVAVTDWDWFTFLRQRPDLDEVNFWKPSGQGTFRALQPGEPYLFKLHAPHNFIVGGGFFAHFAVLPTSLAWEAFGEKNGASSLDEKRRRIEKYRRIPLAPHEDYQIGCIILTAPFFFDRPDWIPAPRDWSPNIVTGKGYDTTEGVGAEIWDEVRLRLSATVAASTSMDDGRPMYGDPTLVRQRLGQGSFRVLITDTYRRCCAVTGEKALPVLEAAHIRPVSDGGRHELPNGLLLRSDIHRL